MESSERKTRVQAAFYTDALWIAEAQANSILGNPSFASIRGHPKFLIVAATRSHVARVPQFSAIMEENTREILKNEAMDRQWWWREAKRVDHMTWHHCRKNRDVAQLLWLKTGLPPSQHPQHSHGWYTSQSAPKAFSSLEYRENCFPQKCHFDTVHGK
jgi:hypothetical protein